MSIKKIGEKDRKYVSKKILPMKAKLEKAMEGKNKVELEICSMMVECLDEIKATLYEEK